jgi:hypothetical protein
MTPETQNQIDRAGVLDEVYEEREKQDEKWGEQSDPAKIRAELIQVAAVAVKIIEYLDRNGDRS